MGWWDFFKLAENLGNMRRWKGWLTRLARHSVPNDRSWDSCRKNRFATRGESIVPRHALRLHPKSSIVMGFPQMALRLLSKNFSLPRALLAHFGLANFPAVYCRLKNHRSVSLILSVCFDIPELALII